MKPGPSLQSLRSCGRHLATVLMWAALLLGVALTANVIGARIIGDVVEWTKWHKAHALYFLLWRLFLYGLIAWEWVVMRQRLRVTDLSAETRIRVLRTEIAAVTAMVLLESSTLLQRE